VPNDPATTLHFQGMAYAQGFAHYQLKQSTPYDIGSEKLPIHAAYDTRLGTFVIQIKPGPQRSQLGMDFLLRNLGGVHSKRQDALAGLHPSQLSGGIAPNSGDQYYFFTRPDAFRGIVDSYTSARSVASNIVGGIFSRFTGPSQSDLLNWAQPLYAEYPGTDLYNTVGVHKLAINLFRDEHFTKYFGSPFDELSYSKLSGISRDLQSLQNTNRNVNDRSTFVLNRMFFPGQVDVAATQTWVWIKAQRYMRNWHDDKVGVLNGLSGTKASLTYTDLLEQELVKVNPLLLWPSESKADAQQVAQARKAIAYPALKTMLTTFDSAPPSLSLMNSVTKWNEEEKRLFGYLTPEQARGLNDAATKRLDVVVNTLLPPYHQRIASLGTGLPAVIKGNAWHQDYMADFAPVARMPQVQDTLRTFTQQRAGHLGQAQADMLAHVQRGYDALSNDLSQEADGQRLRYCGVLNGFNMAWFKVPSDAGQASVQAVKASMAQLGGQGSSLLPPRLAHCGNYPPRDVASGEDLYQELYRSKVLYPISTRGTLVHDDAAARSAMPKPIRNAGFAFRSNVVWALFHGRFDELDGQHYKGQGMGSDMIGQMGANPQVDFTLVTYSQLLSQKYCNTDEADCYNLVGPARNFAWKRVNQKTGEVLRDHFGEVWIPMALYEFYETSYKRAEGISKTDALFSSKGLGILQAFLDLGTGRVLSKIKTGADGETRLSADWEQPILEDLALLINSWPARSYGLWQLQENLVRYKKGRPSLQSLHGFKS
jgi:hypothetical protein